MGRAEVVVGESLGVGVESVNVPEAAKEDVFGIGVMVAVAVLTIAVPFDTGTVYVPAHAVKLKPRDILTATKMMIISNVPRFFLRL
jgi:hypothetical protein